MKLTTPFFPILKRKINKMDLIIYVIKLKVISETERLHNDYRKMFKSGNFIMYCDEKSATISNGYV